MSTPISIHISPQLHQYAVPLSQFIDNHKQYAALAIGALIFSPSHLDSLNITRLLLVQRAATEKSFPNLWEIPGGAVELDDPTILHSVAREVFEETGLHLQRFVRQVGNGQLFKVGHKHDPKQCFKLNFEIEVIEIGTVSRTLDLQDQSVQDRPLQPSVENLDSIVVVVDPQEHQAFKWVREDEVVKATYLLQTGEEGLRKSPGTSPETNEALKLVSEDQQRLILEAFSLHKRDIERLSSGSEHCHLTTPAKKP